MPMLSFGRPDAAPRAGIRPSMPLSMPVAGGAAP
jgi:hypothetical protein